jgi:hypothetical protein
VNKSSFRQINTLPWGRPAATNPEADLALGNDADWAMLRAHVLEQPVPEQEEEVWPDPALLGTRAEPHASTVAHADQEETEEAWPAPAQFQQEVAAQYDEQTFYAQYDEQSQAEYDEQLQASYDEQALYAQQQAAHIQQQAAYAYEQAQLQQQAAHQQFMAEAQRITFQQQTGWDLPAYAESNSGADPFSPMPDPFGAPAQQPRAPASAPFDPFSAPPADPFTTPAPQSHGTPAQDPFAPVPHWTGSARGVAEPHAVQATPSLVPGTATWEYDTVKPKGGMPGWLKAAALAIVVAVGGGAGMHIMNEQRVMQERLAAAEKNRQEMAAEEAKRHAEELAARQAEEARQRAAAAAAAAANAANPNSVSNLLAAGVHGTTAPTAARPTGKTAPRAYARPRGKVAKRGRPGKAPAGHNLTDSDSAAHTNDPIYGL